MLTLVVKSHAKESHNVWSDFLCAAFCFFLKKKFYNRIFTFLGYGMCG